MARLSFAEAFAPGIRGAANILSQSILDNAENERKKNEALKAQQEQQNILAQITRGSINAPKLVDGKFIPQGVSYPNQNDLTLQSQLSGQNYGIFQDWQKQNAPEEDEYYAPDFNKSSPTIRQWNKDKRRFEDTGQPNPYYEEPKIKPDFIETNYNGNKQIRREFYKQSDGTVKTVDIPTGFFKETRTTKTEENGKLYEDLDKGYTKELDQRVDKFITSMDILKATQNSTDERGIPYVDPLTGIQYKISKDIARVMVQSGRDQLQNYLDTQGSAQNEKYWKDANREAWDAVQKEGKGDHGVTTWKYIEEDRHNGEISQADFLEARYRFISKWGYDPYQKLRIK